LDTVIDVRDTNNSQTLMEFVVVMLQECFPLALNMKQELVNLPTASEIDLAQVGQTLKDLWAEYKGKNG
jgi:hypothetical protein